MNSKSRFNFFLNKIRGYLAPTSGDLIFLKKFGMSTIVFYFCLNLSACSTSFLFSTGATISLNSGDIPTNPVGTSGAISFQLSRVNLNQINPTQNLDLIGDGTGKMGQLCTISGQGDPNSTSGPSGCQCIFTFSSPTAPNQSVNQAVIYHESDLVRCNYSTVIPYNVTSFGVFLQVTSTGAKSNTISFSLTGFSGLDPTLRSSYRSVTRFLCKGLVTVSYLLDNNIYDPVQSEDPHFTYSLDYYTSNMGSSLAYFVNSADSSNECPAIPDYSSIQIFSLAPFNGSNVISPPISGQLDRSTFYLATNPTGVFSVPVNAMVAPSVMSNSPPQTGVSPPMGYGANFVTTNGVESCPNTPIPTGYQWVKVWLFRASLPSRNSFAPASNNLSAIVCNPGLWNVATSGTQNESIFPSCYSSANLAPATLNLTPSIWGPRTTSNLTTNTYLADRVVLSAVQGSGGASTISTQCVSLSRPGTSPNQCSQSGSPANPGVGCGVSDNFWGSSGDFWQLNIPQQNPNDNFLIAPYLGCKLANDPLSLCSPTNVGGQSFINTASPLIKNLQATQNFDQNPRSDYLFVVSPTSVTREDITQGTALGNQFIPYRYKTPADCVQNGPCDSSQKLTFLPLLDDINVTVDPTGSDPQRTGIYPICAIQPVQTN
jgi:hypothetical protein